VDATPFVLVVLAAIAYVVYRVAGQRFRGALLIVLLVFPAGVLLIGLVKSQILTIFGLAFILLAAVSILGRRARRAAFSQAEDGPPRAAAAVAMRDQWERTTKHCGQCGTAIADPKARFCGNCGTPNRAHQASQEETRSRAAWVPVTIAISITVILWIFVYRIVATPVFGEKFLSRHAWKLDTSQPELNFGCERWGASNTTYTFDFAKHRIALHSTDPNVIQDPLYYSFSIPSNRGGAIVIANTNGSKERWEIAGAYEGSARDDFQLTQTDVTIAAQCNMVPG